MKLKTCLVFILLLSGTICDNSCEKKRKKLEKMMQRNELDKKLKEEEDLLNVNKYHLFIDEDEKIPFDPVQNFKESVSKSSTFSACPRHIISLDR